ncbi:hypothetical protein K2173_003295 [Erythroxylum novogranatense]|uniref:FCP1 homology domain-containing protein n=1 Tax=Erythroxylum novogranatense TaxID=1862640 RepID=A0AAV8SX59_9ROSI|nr:hypothetical protein K2173_003295 [Erythroxylum novogranatense]
MQTKKRISGRSASRDHAVPKFSRAQKKASENVQGVESKTVELITSSVRKQRCAGSLQKKNSELTRETNLSTTYNLTHNEANDSSLCGQTDHKVLEGVDQCVLETIFSPAFHISKYTGCDIANGELVKSEDSNLYRGCERDYSQLNGLEGFDNLKNFECANDVQSCSDQMLGVDPSCNADLEGTNLSSEVSAIYFAMKNSKLECVDEHGQDSISADISVEDDGLEEFDDFDPFLFIKNLPELSSVVPTFRPVLLPRQTRSCPPTTLVLDLDETLVHSTLEPCEDADFTFPVNFNLQEHTVYVRCRPYLKEFMERVSGLFEIIIFTASQSIYAEQLLNVLDPKRKVFRHRVYRESCVFVEGNYLKDLSVLGRDLARVIIVDNSPQAFGFQVDNGIPIESWFDDRADQELLLLLPFLESMVGAEDVRPLIARKYNLREKIAAAVYPSLCSTVGDPFER